MHTLLEPLVGGALGVWFALSLVAQFRPFSARSPLGRFDVLNLVTPYRFFGPNPRVEDARLFSRQLSGHGPSAEWLLIGNERSGTWLDVLWNPRRRASYGFAKDCWRIAEACRHGVAPDQLESSLPFKRVLNVVRYRTLSPNDAGQFEFRVSIVRFGRGRSDTEEIVFQSGPRGA